jgi:hypothetical protein
MKMAEIIKSFDEAMAIVQRNPRVLSEGCTWRAVYEYEHWRKGRLLTQGQAHNIVTTQGKRYLLYVGLDGSDVTYTQQTGWFIILSGNGAAGAAPTTAPVTANMADATYTNKTGSSGTAFLEFQDYDEAVRQTWTPTLDVSTASITNNAAKPTFNIAAEATNDGKVFGAGLVSRNDKGDATAGDYFLSYANFTTALDVVDNDMVKVGITITLS